MKYSKQDFVRGEPVPWLHDIDAFWEQFNSAGMSKTKLKITESNLGPLNKALNQYKNITRTSRRIPKVWDTMALPCGTAFMMACLSRSRRC
jgi:hypothetical protein